jgi:hopanoid biosynthesis associated RND transporter like protein HpnN
LIGRTVAASTRHPWIVLFLAGVLTLAALVFTARNFAMTADTAQLISQRLDWRQREFVFESAFPQLNNLTLVVIDGATPELADDAARRLDAALKDKPSLFHTVRWPSGGPFFEREGLLFLPLEDVRSATDGLVKAAPMLVRLRGDQSLRGVLVVLSDMLSAVKSGEATLQDIEPAVTALSEAFEDALAGRPAYFSWRTFFSGKKSTRRETRHVLLVQPVMNYAALEPGAAASEAIRETARSLGLDPAHGVNIRLTGPVPLADEEFDSLAEHVHYVLGAMIAALLGILWLAVRSGRVVLAILVTTLTGLVLTAAWGLLVIGRFNLISMAFIPLFVGLGVDFSIQFSVRALAERLVQPSREAALVAAGAGIGRALALSAAAIGAGFFAFLPTSYVGVAELGAIAGCGMVVAFVLSIVLLPALLVLLRFPPPRMAEVGFTMFAPTRGSGGFARSGRRGDGDAAVRALRLRSAEPQESQVPVDDHPAGTRRRPGLDALCDQRARQVAPGGADAVAAARRATRRFARRHPAELHPDAAAREARAACQCGKRGRIRLRQCFIS